MRTPRLVPLVVFLALVVALAWIAGRNRNPAASDKPALVPAIASESTRSPSALEFDARQPQLPPAEGATARSAAEGTPPAPAAANAGEPPEARVEGSVLRPDGRPAALARVQYLECDANGWPSAREDSTVSDDEGHFTIRPAPVGTLQLIAMHDDFAPGEAQTLLLAEGETRRDVKLVLRRFGRIEGFVRDAHEAPRAGTEITVRALDTERALFTTSEAGGHFTLEKVPPGAHEVAAASDEQELALLREESIFLANSLARASASALVQVAEGETARVLLGGVEPGSVRVFGVVRGAGGPRAGCWVWGLPHGDYDPFSNLPHARTDERGEYSLWLARSGHWEFHVDCKPRNVSLEREVEIGSGREQRLDFVLPSGSLSGRVVDRGGRGLPGQQVLLRAERTPKDAPGAALALGWPGTASDAQGGFAFLDLPAARYTLHVRPGEEPGAGAAAAFAQVEVELAADQELAGLEIVLAPECVVRGRVRLPADVAPSVALVLAYDESGRCRASGQSEGDGSFVLHGLSEGRYAFRAECGAWVSPAGARQAISAAHENEVELALGAGVPTAVFVRLAPGARPERVSILIRDSEGNRLDEVELPWRLPEEPFWEMHAAPGSYSIEVLGSDGSRGAETAVLAAGHAARIEVHLQRPK